MKKCAYCGHKNDDKANVCEHCKAMFPHEQINETPDEPIRVTKKYTRSE